MIGRLDHVAIVVGDLDAEAARYRDVLGASVGEAHELFDHGVRLVFVELPNARVELLAPLDEASPVHAFLAKGGGLHHVCYEVEDIEASRARLLAAGLRVLGDGEPRIGAHGRPVLFLHPKDFAGTLIELQQA